MEREAFTKGNLIFRDFEDLIKTGKIKVLIDFTKSGEPKMSLQEWKNNEINRKLMKKWGLLTESKDAPEEKEEVEAKGGKDASAEELNEDSEESGDEKGNRPSFARKMDLKEEIASRKISVREAKELTRRIIERIKTGNK
jgi:hypothetical protein